MAMNINGLSNTGLIYNTQFGKMNNGSAVEESTLVEKVDEEQEKQISEEEWQMKMQEYWAFHDNLWAKQTAAAMSKVAEGQAVAIEIARRMSSGDKVSQADEKTLMGYDPNMYAAAKMSQMMAERQEDKSDDSLTDKFNEKHKNDRKDWISELKEREAELFGDNNAPAETNNISTEGLNASNGNNTLSRVSIDVSV